MMMHTFARNALLPPSACYVSESHTYAATPSMSSRKPTFTSQMVYSVSEKQTVGESLRAAGAKAFGGGIAGAGAMGINVLTLMWMRTTVNYQYRFGMSTTEALKALYNDGGRGLGGVTRFYRGLGPALLQGPLSRFGDTAANFGVLAFLDGQESTKDLPVALKTAAASAGAAAFRIVLMPIDTLKTTMQVNGKGAIGELMIKARAGGPSVFWHGALGASAATMAGHYPWFFVYNSLNANLPRYDRDTQLAQYLGRSAIIGFCASAVSDTVSNSIRVLKTGKQTSNEHVTYTQVAKRVIAQDGIQGLLFRGLTTKIISNGVQGLVFSVLLRLIQDWQEKTAKEAEDARFVQKTA